MANFSFVSNQVLERNFSNLFKFTRIKHFMNRNCFHQVRTPEARNKKIDLSNYFRTFHSNKINLQNIYVNAENNHAYKMLRSVHKDEVASKVNQEFIVKSITKEEFESILSQHWRKETASNILRAFQNAYPYAKENNIAISDTRFDNLVDGLMDRCQDLTDEELSELLTYLYKYPRPESLTSHNFHDTWSALDDICCWRLPNWPTKKILLFADHWYWLGLIKYTDYISSAITRLSRKVRHLSPAELVQTLFYINVRRKAGSMFELECQIEQYAPELSVDELAIISMGYFKTKTVIQSTKLLNIMLEKVIQNISTVNEISLAAILKIIRYSPHLRLVDKLKELQDKIVPQIDRLSILCCVHIALLGTVALFFHPESLSKIAQKYADNISAARLKDIERLIFALTLYNFNPQTKPCIFEAALNELRNENRQAEFERHPRSMSCCVQFLTLQQIFSHDLINKVLDAEFIKRTYGKYQKSIGREILFLDCSVEVDCPDYKGHRLNTKLRRSLTHWKTDWMPEINQKYRLTAADKLFLDVLDTIRCVHGGEDYVHVNYILPHFQKPDIIICKTKSGEPLKIKHFSKYTLGDIMRPENTEELTWYAIIPGSLNMFIRDTTVPLGVQSTKIRQLKQIGYIPVVIPTIEYLNLPRKQKEEYIRNKIG